MPTKIPKITTAIIEVERAPVKSANGLVGIKLTNICGIVRSATLPKRVSSTLIRAVSRTPSERPAAERAKICVTAIPMSAAIMVVNNKIPMVNALIFPNEPEFSSFTTAAIIDTKTNGIITIFNRPT